MICACGDGHPGMGVPTHAVEHYRRDTAPAVSANPHRTANFSCHPEQSRGIFASPYVHSSRWVRRFFDSLRSLRMTFYWRCGFDCWDLCACGDGHPGTGVPTPSNIPPRSGGPCVRPKLCIQHSAFCIHPCAPYAAGKNTANCGKFCFISFLTDERVI